MSISVDNNWWKYLFDDIYLLTDARSVCDENLTCQEVNFLEKNLGFHKTSPILDLCGGYGRHSLELSRRGYQNITVLDYSKYLIDLGIKKATQEGLNTIFIQGDARSSGLRAQTFQFIIIMASSFGYFINESENMKILKEGSRLLMPKGAMLLDIPDRNYLIHNFKPFSFHKVNEDISVSRKRELVDDIIYSQERVISKKNGCMRSKTYCTRLYSREKISKLLQSAGFLSITFQNEFMNRELNVDFGCMTNRMVVIAKKGTQ